MSLPVSVVLNSLQFNSFLTKMASLSPLYSQTEVDNSSEESIICLFFIFFLGILASHNKLLLQVHGKKKNYHLLAPNEYTSQYSLFLLDSKIA